MMNYSPGLLGKNRIPLHLQTELALLWRTLSVIHKMPRHADMALEFYSEFLCVVKDVAPLSLSAAWVLNDNDEVLENIVGIPPGGKNEIIPLIAVPELSYLSNADNKDSYEHSDDHDPLDIVQKLFESAESLALELPLADKGVVINVCLSLAVKSGRFSLLSKCIDLLLNMKGYIPNIDSSLLDDIKQFMKKQSDSDLNNHKLDKEFEDILEWKGNFNDNFLESSTQSNSMRTIGGNLMTCGKADHGKLGHGDTQVHRLIPTLVDGLNDVRVVKMASMSTYAVAVGSTGMVYVWGTGGSAGAIQGLRTDIEPQLLESLPMHLKVIDVSCGLGHALFLLDNGRVFAWGNGGNGRLGMGDTSDRAEACLVAGLCSVVVKGIQCGASHSLALSVEGRLYSWGKNTQGQCGRGNLEDVLSPLPNTALEKEVVSQVAAGWEHSLVLLSTGLVYAFGCGYKDSRRGQVPPVLGLGHNEGRHIPERVLALEDISKITCGWDHCLALDTQGRVYSWGSGQNGKLGLGTEENVSVPTVLASLLSVKFAQVSAGCEHSAAFSDDGVLYTWGHGDGGRLGHGDNSPCTSPVLVTCLQSMGAKLVDVHCGDKFTMLIIQPDDTNKKKSSDAVKNSSEFSVYSDNSATELLTRLHVTEKEVHRLIDEVEDETESKNSTILLGIQTLLGDTSTVAANLTSTPSSVGDSTVPLQILCALRLLSLLARTTKLWSISDVSTQISKLRDAVAEDRHSEKYIIELSAVSFASLLAILKGSVQPHSIVSDKVPVTGSFEMPTITEIDGKDSSVAWGVVLCSLQLLCANLRLIAAKNCLQAKQRQSTDSNIFSFRPAAKTEPALSTSGNNDGIPGQLNTIVTAVPYPNVELPPLHSPILLPPHVHVAIVDTTAGSGDDNLGKSDDEEEDEEDEGENDLNTGNSGNGLDYGLGEGDGESSQHLTGDGDDDDFEEEATGTSSRHQQAAINRFCLMDEMSDVTYRELDLDQHTYKETDEGLGLDGETERSGGSHVDQNWDRNGGERSPALSHEGNIHTSAEQLAAEFGSRHDDASSLGTLGETDDGEDSVDFQRALFSSMESKYDSESFRNGKLLKLTQAEVEELLPSTRQILLQLANLCWTKASVMPDPLTDTLEKDLIFLVWTQCQLVLRDGYMALLPTLDDRRSLLLKILRHPNEFMFAIPGLAGGICNMLPLRNQFGLEVLGDVHFLVPELVAFLTFIEATLATTAVTADSSSIDSGLRRTMQTQAQDALYLLTHELLVVVIDILLEKELTHETETTGGFPDSLNWGEDICKLLDKVLNCFDSELENISSFTRINCSEVDSANIQKLFQKSFTSSVFCFLRKLCLNENISISHIMGFGPYALRILSLFSKHSLFLQNKSFFEEFQIILKFLARASNMLATGSDSIRPPNLRMFHSDCVRLVDVRALIDLLVETDEENRFELAEHLIGHKTVDCMRWLPLCQHLTLTEPLVIPPIAKDERAEQSVLVKQSYYCDNLFTDPTRQTFRRGLYSLDAYLCNQISSIHVLKDRLAWSKMGLEVSAASFSLCFDVLFDGVDINIDDIGNRVDVIEDRDTTETDRYTINKLRTTLFAIALKNLDSSFHKNIILVIETFENHESPIHVLDNIVEDSFLCAWLSSFILCLVLLENVRSGSSNLTCKEIAEKATRLVELPLTPLSPLLSPGILYTCCKQARLVLDQYSDPVFSSILAVVRDTVVALQTLTRARFTRDGSSEAYMDLLLPQVSLSDKAMNIINSYQPLVIAETTVESTRSKNLESEVDVSSYGNLLVLLSSKLTLQQTTASALWGHIRTQSRRLAIVTMTEVLRLLPSNLVLQRYFTSKVMELFSTGITSLSESPSIPCRLTSRDTDPTPYSVLVSLDSCISNLISTTSNTKTYQSSVLAPNASLLHIPHLLSCLGIAVKLSGAFATHPRLSSPLEGLLALTNSLESIDISNSETVLSAVSYDLLHSRLLWLEQAVDAVIDIGFKTFEDKNSPDISSFGKSKCPCLPSALLPISSRLLGLLGHMLSKQRMAQLDFLRSCYEHQIHFLTPAFKDLEITSPSVLPSVFTPNGDFLLGFWLQIPQRLATSAHGTKVHILSRVPEVGDINFVKLVQGQDSCPSHPSVYLHISSSGAYLEANLTVSDGLSTLDTNTKNTKLQKLRSTKLPWDRWIYVTLKYYSEVGVSTEVSRKSDLRMDTDRSTTTSIEEDTVSGTSTRRNSMDDYSATTTTNLKSSTVKSNVRHAVFSLFVDNTLQESATCPAGRSPLHQVLVIGPLPSLQIYEKVKPADNLLTSYGSNSLFQLADVFWTSSTSSNDSVTNTSATSNCFGLEEPPSCLENLIRINASSIKKILLLIQNCLKDVLSSLCSGPRVSADNHSTEAVLLSVVSACSDLCDTSFTLFCSGADDLQDALHCTLGSILQLIKQVGIYFPALIWDNSSSTTSSFLDMSNGSNLFGTVFRDLITSYRRTIARLIVLTISLISLSPSRYVTPLTSLILFQSSSNALDNSSTAKTAVTQLMSLWCNRIWCGRDNFALSINAKCWSTGIHINENTILTVVSFLVAETGICGLMKHIGPSIFTSGLSGFAKLIGSDYETMMMSLKLSTKDIQSIRVDNTLKLLGLVSSGGWFPFVKVGSIADMLPRSLFLCGDPKGLEVSLFPCTATVIAVGSSVRQESIRIGAHGRSGGVLLTQCAGASHFRTKQSMKSSTSRSADQDENPLILPRGQTSHLQATEMVAVRDITPSQLLPSLLETIDNPVISADNLILLLRRVVLNRPTGSATGAGAGISSTVSAAGTQERLVPASRSAEELLSSSGAGLHDDALSLMLTMSHLRALMVQVFILQHQNSTSQTITDVANRKELLNNLSRILCRDLPNIVSIAATDPVAAVTSAFSSGLFKGTSLDVLKNLLKEGDVSFLEKISLRVWKQLRSSKAERNNKAEVGQMTAVAGEIQTIENKVRALSHFPTVRLQGVTLGLMTGRWYYECTLLSDGLMQIGWADASFRCDPVCGQGVGDHLHSWAFDGLRTKKWCVSCESYGRRWRVGDVVGVLVDMDLQEMRFYLNGEDLGPAFTNFNASDLFPALSLNVRQSVRVNFGESIFRFPPNEIDNLPFSPVINAVSKARLASSVHLEPSLPMRRMSTAVTTPGVTLGDDAAAREVGVERVGPWPLNATAVASRRLGSAPSEPGGALNGDVAIGITRIRSQRGMVDSQSSDSVDDRIPGSSVARRGEDDRETASSRGGRRAGTTSTANGPGNSASVTNAETASTANATTQNQQQQQVLELRRQALIENLIGMGFPVDWALRAAEHCDASVSESAAIAWIIERMEQEQAKLEEYERDSRMNGEDFDDNDDAALDQLHRVDINNDSKIDESAVDSHSALLLGDLRSRTSATTSAHANSTRVTAASSGSATNEAHAQKKQEAVGHASLQLDYDTSGSGGSYNNAAHELGQGCWNRDVCFGPVLAGRYTARRRHDADKQEVLLQVSELEPVDLCPIISSCQIAICIVYARAILMRLLSFLFQDPEGGLSEPMTSVQISKLLIDDTSSTSIGNERNAFRKSMLAALIDGCSPALVGEALKVCFRQYCCLSSSPERLFPSVLYGSAMDMHGRIPPVSPFTSRSIVSFSRVLAGLETSLFSTSLGSLAVDESSVQSMTSISSLLDLLRWLSSSGLKGSRNGPSGMSISSGARQLEGRLFREMGVHVREDVHQSDGLRTFLSSASSRLLGHLIEEAISHIELAAQGVYDKRDWISFGLEKESDTDVSPTESGSGSPKKDGIMSIDCTPVTASKLNILWSYTLLRQLLTSDVDQLQHSTSTKWDPLSVLTSSDSLARILKGSLSPNMSLKHCVFDIGALILARVNSQITRHGEKGPDATQLQVAAEYYVSIAKERRLLQTFANRMKSEGSHRRTFSAYTRTVNSFLLQWQILRRVLGLYSHSHVQEDLVQDWALSSAIGKQPVTQNTSSPTHSASGPSEVQESLFVTQLSSNSITVSWSLKEPASTGHVSKPGSSAGSRASLLSAEGVNRLLSQFHLHDSSHSGGSAGRESSLCIISSVNSGIETPTTILPNIAAVGSHRIEGLDPDTLYKVSVVKRSHTADLDDDKSESRSSYSSTNSSFRRTTNSNREEKASYRSRSSVPLSSTGNRTSTVSKEISLYASTEGEAVFILDSTNCAPSLNLTNSNLTVRNTINKKWSTCRATVRLTSGRHHWSVHIDRCVSKNIFIGVVTPEARLDNYVGCDKFGWAFLANKAVWHNKGKMKSYGELFRTGDTVTVNVDLDLGILSFALNGKDIGPAVIEGLSGPLYPAFSLYNEEDQISLVPPRACCEGLGIPSSAERVLGREEALHGLLQLLSSPKESSGADDRLKELSAGLGIELYRRWTLWQHGVGIRTVATGGDIISIVTSNTSCLQFSEGRFKLGDFLLWEKNVVQVIGTSRHRLWVQFGGSGALVGCTRQTLQQLLGRGTLAQFRSTCGELGLDDRNYEGAPILVKPTVDVSADLNSGHTTAAETDNAVEFFKVMFSTGSWSRSEDELLVQWLELIARARKVHPLNLGYDMISSPRSFVNFARTLKSHDEESNTKMPASLAMDASVLKLSSSKISIDITEFAARCAPLSLHSGDDIRRRAMLLIHFNDLLIPLLPVLCPGSGGHMASNHPSEELRGLKDLIFDQVKWDYLYRLAAPTCLSTTVVSGGAGVSDAPSTSCQSLPIAQSGAPTLPVLLSEVSINYDILDGSARSAILAESVSSSSGLAQPLEIYIKDGQLLAASLMDTISSDDLTFVYQKDMRWRLIAGLQCSLLGQMIHVLETTATKSRASVASPGPAAPHAWESCLRKACCQGGLWADLVQPSKRSTVLLIRSLKTDLDSLSSSSYLRKVLSIRSRIYDSDSAGVTRDIISDWSLFELFLVEAISETQGLLDDVFVHHQLSYTMSAASKDTTAAGEVFLVLNTCHYIGVLLGIALRSGVSPMARLPLDAWQIIAGEISSLGSTGVSEKESSHADFVKAAALALRHGIITIYPEEVLELLSPGDLINKLSGVSCCHVSLLRNFATYDAGISANDDHVIYFWIALMSLSREQICQFLCTMWSFDMATGSELFLYRSTLTLPKPFIISSPPNLDLFVQDDLEMTFEADGQKNGELYLFLPRYSSMHVTHAKTIGLFVKILGSYP